MIALVKKEPEKQIEWRDVPGYEGLYQVSEFGDVKALAKTVPHGRSKMRPYPERVMNLRKNNFGYLSIELSKNGEQKNLKVHRLVAMAFVPNSDPKRLIHIDHLDMDKTNNHYSNLEWVTQEENSHRAKAKGAYQTPGQRKKEKPIEAVFQDGTILYFERIKDAKEHFEIAGKGVIPNRLNGIHKDWEGIVFRYAKKKRGKK